MRIYSGGLVICVLSLACAPDSRGPVELEMTATGSTSMSPTAGGSTTQPRLDLGATSAASAADDGGTPAGCRGVDFLFVVDNSRSMADEQASLIASFPGFIDSIADQLAEAQDFNAMVVDTDGWPYAGCLQPCNLFGECPIAPEFECGSQPEFCDAVLGAGVVHPVGANSSEQDCALGEDRFISDAQVDLASKFECAARVGTSATQDPEQPVAAALAAVAETGDAADCNVGFVRDEAVLVVTIITDEDDDAGDGSPGTVEQWHEALVDAKQGREAGVVVLGLFGDNDQDDGICLPLDESTGQGAQASERLRQLVESFGAHGIAGSVCAPSYESFFAQAVGQVALACGTYTPAG